MIKDIVVNLGLGERDPAGDFAISIAETFGAHLLGIAFIYEPVIPGSVMGGIPPEFIESQRAESDKAGARARSPVSSRRPSAPASRMKRAAASASIAGAADRLGRLARRFDLVIVGQPDRDKSAPEEVVDEGVLFESGRPVIFVPYIQKEGLKLDRVMVCWDGSRAATRAIADSHAVPAKGQAGRNRHRRQQGRQGATKFPAPISASISPATARRSTSSASLRRTSTSPPRSCPTRPTRPPT